MSDGGKSFKRSDIVRLARQLGHDPEDVVNIEIRPQGVGLVIVTRLSRNSNGEVRLDAIGPVTGEFYHAIHEDMGESAADGAGT